MQVNVPLVIWLGFGLSGVLFFTYVYERYLRIRFGAAFLLAVVALAAGVGVLWGTEWGILQRSPLLERGGWWLDSISPAGANSATYVHSSFGKGPPTLAFMLTVAVAVAFVAKLLYRAWLLDVMTPSERQAGAKGVRAWLGPVNSLVGLGIVVGAYVGMGWPPWATAVVIVALLLSYPLLHAIRSSAVKVEEGAEEERRRVLALVEAGKITGADGAELIGALGQSRVATKPSGGLSGARRFMLMGALLVLVGFCLPWFTIDLEKEMQSTMEGMTPAMQQNIPGVPRSLPEGLVRVPTLTQSWLLLRGGDIGKGLGWIILAMGLGAAVLPLLWPTRPANRQSQRGVSLAGLGVGTVLLIYLTGMGIPQMDVGIYLAMAGYAVLWIGALREYVGWGQRAGIAVAA